MKVPAWVDAELPPRGPCAFCGGDDARHRILDAIYGAFRAGDSVEALAENYLLPEAFVLRVTQEWRAPQAPGRE